MFRASADERDDMIKWRRKYELQAKPGVPSKSRFGKVRRGLDAPIHKIYCQRSLFLFYKNIQLFLWISLGACKSPYHHPRKSTQ